MTNPTTPFSWQMPTASDLVTDLPADFETFGQAVATSMADLLGGTTGQVLSKASNTDMDFTWVAQDDSNAIQNAIVDAKGDLIAATAADTPARIAVGTNGQVLTADSTAATGLKWATPSAGGTFPKLTYVSPTANFTTTSTTYVDATGYTITFTPVSATNVIEVKFNAGYATSGNTRSFRILLDGVDKGSIDLLIGEINPTMILHLTNVSATSHTIKLQMLSVGGGTATLAGSASGYIADFSILEIY
jgi:hypothetical protein